MDVDMGMDISIGMYLDIDMNMNIHIPEAAIEKTCDALIHRKMFSECLALFEPSRRN
jgi:hypothetical protein